MLEPEIIYEAKDFIAVNKPYGLLVHDIANRKEQSDKLLAISDKPESTLVDWLLARYPEMKTVGDDPTIRPGIVHRLDCTTSGIMLVARTQNGFDYLKSEFQAHRVRKIYLAWVSGAPRQKSGRIEFPIGIGKTLKRSVHSPKMMKTAITEYTILKETEKEGNKISLLEVRPLTGRTHQVRVHLAAIGCPVAGDSLYGPKRQPHWAKRIMLHAYSLEFTSPQGANLRLEAEPPEDFGMPKSSNVQQPISNNQ